MANDRPIQLFDGRTLNTPIAISDDRVVILPSTVGHADELARNLRRADREVISLTDHPNAIVRSNYKASFLRRTALVDGNVAAMWGLAAVAPIRRVFSAVLAGTIEMGMAISVLADAAGALESAYGAKESAAYQAEVARINAGTAGWNAKQTMQAGEVAAANKGLQTRAQIGAMKAGQGASGVDVNTGSALDTRVGTSAIGMTDARTITSDAAKRAYGYETNQASFLGEANQAEEAGNIGAISSLITGISSVSNDFAKWQMVGG
jgi:hypothetical protein